MPLHTTRPRHTFLSLPLTASRSTSRVMCSSLMRWMACGLSSRIQHSRSSSSAHIGRGEGLQWVGSHRCSKGTTLLSTGRIGHHWEVGARVKCVGPSSPFVSGDTVSRYINLSSQSLLANSVQEPVFPAIMRTAAGEERWRPLVVKLAKQHGLKPVGNMLV